MNPNEFKIVNVHSGEEAMAFQKGTDDLYGVGYFFKHYINGEIFGIGLCLESEGWKRAEESMQFKVGDKVKIKGVKYIIDIVKLENGILTPIYIKNYVGEIKEIHKDIALISFSGVGIGSLHGINYTVLLSDLIKLEQPKEKPMKFEIYDEDKPEKEQLIRLRLRNMGGGGISVDIVNEYGDTEQLLIAFIGRKIRLAYDVPKDYGFDLDEQGRIKVCE